MVAHEPHTPARSSVVGTEATTTSRPRLRRDRHHGIQTVVHADGERLLAGAGALHRHGRVGPQGCLVSEHLPVRLDDDHLRPAGAEVGHGAREGLGVVEGRDQGGDALRLLAGAGGGAVLGEVRDEEAQRHDERHDDGGRRGGHEPRDAPGHQPSPSAVASASVGEARRTPTPRTLCRYAG